MTILNIKEGYVEVKEEQEHGTTLKNISVDSLSSVFRKSVDVQTDWLPGEYGVQKYAVKGNIELYLYLEPARVVNAKYEIESRDNPEPDYDDYEDEDEYEEAHATYLENMDSLNNKTVAPILAWFIMLEKRSSGSYNVLKTAMFAMKQPILTGYESLYSAPFANVYDHDEVCWGYNTVQIPALKSIQGLSTLFFNAIANSDLDSNRFIRFERKLVGGNASRSVHLQMETNEMFKKGYTAEQVLELVNNSLSEKSKNVNDMFNYYLQSI